jgi:hypothetical protein
VGAIWKLALHELAGAFWHHCPPAALLNFSQQTLLSAETKCELNKKTVRTNSDAKNMIAIPLFLIVLSDWMV